MRRPNVLLINCDDMGYCDLGCYGSKVNKTPTIDYMAKNGVMFTDFYAASPVCSPSRAALMTGCFPPRVGIHTVLFPGDAEGLDSNEYTMAQMFRDAGYKTMIVGKWHLGDQPDTLPLHFGFDAYYGLPYSNDMGVQKGKTDFVKYPPLPLIRDNKVVEEQPDQKSLTERYTEQCVSFIQDNKDNPFFLYFAHMHVHLPLYAADRFVAQSDNGDYGACVEEIDWSCRVLLDTLTKNGLLEDTIVLFTSDNGSRGDHGASNAPFRGGKHTSWEGGVRVPFIVYWKGKVKGGRENRNIASNVDLLPTLTALVDGRESDRTIDGIDISKMLFDDTVEPRKHMVYYTAQQHGSRLCAIRVGKWKKHYSRDGKPVCELYNLHDDPGETTNIEGQYVEIEQEIDAMYEEYKRRLGDDATGIQGNEMRPCHLSINPHTLTEYSENHPYIIAMYDKEDAG